MKTFKFQRYDDTTFDDDTWQVPDNREVWICIHRLNEYFAVPKTAKTLWVSVRKTPQRGWVQLQFNVHGWLTHFDRTRLTAGEYIISGTRIAVADALGSPLHAQPFYVKVEYE